MDELDIIAEDDRWTQLGLLDIAMRAVPGTLEHLGFDPSAHAVAILACDDARIAALNADFRDKPKPTNVLSWPSEQITAGSPPPLELGDIAIAFETCEREAQEQNKTIQAHVTHLLVHATLHLLGYDHQIDAEATKMEALEVEILGKLGVSDPY